MQRSSLFSKIKVVWRVGGGEFSWIPFLPAALGAFLVREALGYRYPTLSGGFFPSPSLFLFCDKIGAPSSSKEPQEMLEMIST